MLRKWNETYGNERARYVECKGIRFAEASPGSNRFVAREGRHSSWVARGTKRGKDLPSGGFEVDSGWFVNVWDHDDKNVHHAFRLIDKGMEAEAEEAAFEEAADKLLAVQRS